jgi:ABC-type sugar transport system ATPase subunit
MTSVKLAGVSKRYSNGFEAVHGLNLDVGSGEFIALVGPSGCGKSTTLRMIAGLEEISAGELLINGERANEKSPKERQIGMVFQSYALYPHMTARENIAFGLTLQRLPKAEIEQRVEQVATKLQINELLDRKPKEMSGGQRQRVAMARSVARRPNIFLFDEPLSNLDAQLRAEMRIEISTLQRELKATSFYVTHDQVEAMTLADRVVLLCAGIVQQIGPPLELHDHPANRFVATFIGSPTMNIIRTELTHSGLQILDWLVTLDTNRVQSLHTSGVNVGDRLDLGIRPHQIDVQFDHQTTESQTGIITIIKAIEPLGSETICYCQPIKQTLDKPIVVKVASGLKVDRGQRCILSFDPHHIHLFTADEEGVRLP